MTPACRGNSSGFPAADDAGGSFPPVPAGGSAASHQPWRCLTVTTAPASPERRPEGPPPDMPDDLSGPGRPVSGAPGLPDDADRDGDVDVLYLAGQRPASPGEWLLITAAGGLPGAEFTARVLPADGRRAHGGDVLVHLATEPPGTLEPLTLSVGTWAV